MSNNYGYVSSSADAPTQEYKSNKGIFNVDDIYDLNSNDNWTNPGQWELIERQELSGSVTEVVFTNIKETEYQNHILYQENVGLSANGYLYFSSDGGSSYTSGYRYANTYVIFNTGPGDEQSNGTTQIYFGGVGAPANGIILMSNLGDPGKIASVNYQHVGPTVHKLGHGVTQGAAAYNAFKITGGASITTGTFVLYGIKGNL